MQFKLPDSISETIFRTNDIRGTLGETLSGDVVYAIGLALGSFAKELNQNKFVVAYDSRESSPLLSSALTQGLLETGCDVIDIGSTPTPVLYFATHTLDAMSGAIITGSHNPSGDNGLKIVLRRKIISEKELKLLCKRIQERNFIYGSGQTSSLNIIPTYIDYITKQIHLNRKLRVVADCGNAIPGRIVPELLCRIGCDVIELFCEVKEDFPNHFPDPTDPKNLTDLIKSVKENQADIGVAFDSDGDRLGVVTNKGKIIWPDRQIMLIAKDILIKNPGTKFIYDVKCTMHLGNWIIQSGGEPLMWKTGHSLIEEKLHETKAIFAGEMSGHFFFNDRWFGFDDGIYSAARLLEILSKDERTPDEVFASLPDSVNTPELRIMMPEEKTRPFIDKFKKTAKFGDGKITTLDGIRVDFSFGFGLVRASNTTPCLVLRFEADNDANLKYIQELFKRQLLSIDSNLNLPF